MIFKNKPKFWYKNSIMCYFVQKNISKILSFIITLLYFISFIILFYVSIIC